MTVKGRSSNSFVKQAEKVKCLCANKMQTEETEVESSSECYTVHCLLFGNFNPSGCFPYLLMLPQ